MFGFLLTSVTSFISRQWVTITSVGFGVYLLFRSIRYIENSALSREEVKRLRDDIARQKHGRFLRNEYVKQVDNYDDSRLDRILRDWGEYREDT